LTETGENYINVIKQAEKNRQQKQPQRNIEPLQKIEVMIDLNPNILATLKRNGLGMEIKN
jgi:hypothetical protein